MSMLSAQCDELRELATRYDELQVGAVKTVTMPSDMGSVLRDAADTIWELRNRCTDLADERETAERNRTRNAREYARLCHENDKLRELAENLLMAFMVLETPKEQQECIDRAIELRHELNILPMETFDVGELGMEVDE